jgi:hypothetical protein
MQLRLEQDTLASLKRTMELFLPTYFNNDLDLPTEFHYNFTVFWETWIIDWTDITYKAADLDIKDIKIHLTNHFGPLIIVDFPAIESWEIDATQTVNSWLLPSTSPVELKIEGFDIDF